MRAVTFDITIPRYVLGKTLGGITEAAVFGALSGLRFGDVPEPPLPGDGWVKLVRNPPPQVSHARENTWVMLVRNDRVGASPSYPYGNLCHND